MKTSHLLILAAVAYWLYSRESAPEFVSSGTGEGPILDPIPAADTYYYHFAGINDVPANDLGVFGSSVHYASDPMGYQFVGTSTDLPVLGWIG